MENTILITFVALKALQHTIETWLSGENRRFYLDSKKREEARTVLGMSEEDMNKTLAYTEDKYKFGRFSDFVSLLVTLAFLVVGGFGFCEQVAHSLTAMVSDGPSPIWQGLFFFGTIGVLSSLFSLPFGWYRSFVIEERHGFNRQTFKIFVADRIKGLVLTVALGAPLVAGILWIMSKMGNSWWIYAWVLLTGFSIFAAWMYPTLLAPIFNKFSPLPEGSLKEKIFSLAQKINFQAGGISIMDASKRSSHGNAYFTGVFGKKKIVLFDTLVESMEDDEVVAVLAHELGHFKLHHVRWSLLRGIATTGLTFYLMSLCLPLEVFYKSFHLEGISNYGALTVFSMWFGLVSFVMQPMETFLSRRNEFAADAFALSHIADKRKLGDALLKLREKSHAMPLTHPWFSRFYYSHPPMLERLKAMSYL